MSATIQVPMPHGGPYVPPLKKRVTGWLAMAAVHLAVLGWLWHVPEPEAAKPAEHAMMVKFVAELPMVVQQPQPVQPAQPTPPVPPKPAPKMIATPNPTSTAAITAPPEEVSEKPVEEVSPPPLASPASATSEATSSEDDVVPPDFRAAYLNNPGPRYPNASRRRREEGIVMLKVLVSASGLPDQVLVDKSSGFAELDDAAASIVKERWRFVPARQRNVAVPAWVVVPMSFELKRR